MAIRPRARSICEALPHVNSAKPYFASSRLARNALRRRASSRSPAGLLQLIEYEAPCGRRRLARGGRMRPPTSRRERRRDSRAASARRRRRQNPRTPAPNGTHLNLPGSAPDGARVSFTWTATICSMPSASSSTHSPPRRKDCRDRDRPGTKGSGCRASTRASW